MRSLILAALVTVTGCAAVHQRQIDDLRAQGQHARADCYEVCDPGDAVCTMNCDRAHPAPLLSEQDRQNLRDVAAIAGAMEATQRVDQGRSPAPGKPPGPAAPSAQPAPPAGKRTLVINGKSFTGGEHLGRPCTGTSPCPDGYSCYVIVDSDHGQCVESN